MDEIRVVYVCAGCGEEHDAFVILEKGDLPGGFSDGGWWYVLTFEDRGKVEGVSIPVYRPTRPTEIFFQETAH